jgi:peroxiredoxin (alkyl hydroperoxide reductase subunit C)
VKLPTERAAKAVWQPQIHDKFPDFTAPTTKGVLSFAAWGRGHWVVLVSHPAAFTPVCTSEITSIAKRMSEFDERNVKVMALTCDPLDRVQAWTESMEAAHGIHIPFPHVADQQSVIAQGCGLLHYEPMLDGEYCARRTFLIDPTGTIRLILDYPVNVGRSVDELLRVIDASILSEKMGVLAPSDWRLGEPLMLLDQVARRDLGAAFGANRKGANAYFRSDHNLAEQPGEPTDEAMPAIDTEQGTGLQARQRAIALARLVKFPEH